MKTMRFVLAAFLVCFPMVSAFSAELSVPAEIPENQTDANAIKYDDRGYDYNGFDKRGSYRDGGRWDPMGYNVVRFNANEVHISGSQYNEEGLDAKAAMKKFFEASRGRR